MKLVSSNHREVYHLGTIRKKNDFYSLPRGVAEFGQTVDIDVYVTYSKVFRPEIKPGKVPNFRSGKFITREVSRLEPGDYAGDILSWEYFRVHRYPAFVKDTIKGVETRKMFRNWPGGKSVPQDLASIDSEIVEMLIDLPDHVRSVFSL